MSLETSIDKNTAMIERLIEALSKECDPQIAPPIEEICPGKNESINESPKSAVELRELIVSRANGISNAKEKMKEVLLPFGYDTPAKLPADLIPEVYIAFDKNFK